MFQMQIAIFVEQNRKRLCTTVLIDRSQESGLPISIRVHVADRTFNLHKVR